MTLGALSKSDIQLVTKWRMDMHDISVQSYRFFHIVIDINAIFFEQQ